MGNKWEAPATGWVVGVELYGVVQLPALSDCKRRPIMHALSLLPSTEQRRYIQTLPSAHNALKYSCYTNPWESLAT